MTGIYSACEVQTTGSGCVPCTLPGPGLGFPGLQTALLPGILGEGNNECLTKPGRMAEERGPRRPGMASSRVQRGPGCGVDAEGHYRAVSFSYLSLTV